MFAELTGSHGVHTFDLFDIRPLHGTIAAGQAMETEFVFRGELNMTVFGTVLCEVVGRPTTSCGSTPAPKASAFRCRCEGSIWAQC